MKVEFKSELSIQSVSKYGWRVTSPLIVEIDSVTRIIQAGYETDLASVPRLPILHSLFGGKANKSAVMHDWLYDDASLSRRDCDKAFYYGIISEGHNRSTAFFMWLGVRLGGKSRYGKAK